MTTSGGGSRGAWPLKLLRMIFREEETSTWKYCERAIAAVGSLGTVIAIFLIYYQTTQTNEQIDAMWYQLRPSLYIEPIADKDVKLGRIFHTTVPDTLAKTGVYTISYSTTNVGNSTAVLDSMYVDVVYRNFCFRTGSSCGGDVRTAGKPVEAKIETILESGQRTYFDIRLVYTWDVSEKRDERFQYRKPYQVEWGDSGWSFHTISPGKFDSIVASFFGVKDVRISDTGTVYVKPIP